jgi:hypothetical protein
MWDACGLTLDELSEKGEFDIVRHDIGGTLDVATLHEEFKVRHDLVLELLKPLVELHMILVGDGVIVLTSASLAPKGLCEFEGMVDLGVKSAIPLGSLPIKEDGENAGLYAKLNKRAAVGIGGGEDTFLSLIASGSTSGDIAKLWPGEVVGEHSGVRGKNG